MGVSLSAGAWAEAEAVARNKGEAKASLSAAATAAAKATAEAEIAIMASPRAVAAMFAALLARHELEICGLDEVEDLEPDPEEEEIDAEMEMTDDDEPLSEAEPDVCFSDGGAPFVEDAYELLVEVTPGGVRCHPPEDEYAGALIAKSKRAMTCLSDHSRRMKIYATIAQWLESDQAAFLRKGIEGLKDLKRTTQAEFVDKFFKDGWKATPTSKKGTFSKCLNHARLVWEDASMPLGALFGK